jgi:hypothetical protein
MSRGNHLPRRLVCLDYRSAGAGDDDSKSQQPVDDTRGERGVSLDAPLRLTTGLNAWLHVLEVSDLPQPCSRSAAPAVLNELITRQRIVPYAQRYV